MEHAAHAEAIPEVPHVDLGGTSKPIADTISYGVNVTPPDVTSGAYKQDLKNLANDARETLQGLRDKFGPSAEGELSDQQKLEKEQAAHRENVDQLKDLQGRISTEVEQDDSQKNIDRLIKDTQTAIREQDALQWRNRVRLNPTRAPAALVVAPPCSKRAQAPVAPAHHSNKGSPGQASESSIVHCDFSYGVFAVRILDVNWSTYSSTPFITPSAWAAGPPPAIPPRWSNSTCNSTGATVWDSFEAVCEYKVTS
jgi:hypothetical protein